MSLSSARLVGLGFIVQLTSACAAKAAAIVTTVTICGDVIALPQLLPPADSGPVVMMAAPCLESQGGAAPSIPGAYQRYVELQPSRPSDGIWVPYDDNATKTMEADYRRLWNTGLLDDLSISVTDHTFSNGVIGKFVTYTAHESRPKFEVASIKLNKAGDDVFSLLFQPGGRLTTTASLHMLIRAAYRLEDVQVSGGPSWIDSDRFDLVAKAEDNAEPEQLRLMLRTLLADRFKLIVRRESRPLQVYALVVARSDGRVDPQLHPSQTDCVAVVAATRAPGGPPPAPPQPGARPTCGMFGGLGRFTAGSASMAQLATSLSQQVNRIVLDRTGLTGVFDFDLAWTPEQLPRAPDGRAPRINGVDIDPNGPSIFTALQEQLGLKLESTRAQVEVLVIDSVEQPTPD